jgi:hypothetical protein
VVAGRSCAVLATWLGERDEQWKAEIATASPDPFRSDATAPNVVGPTATPTKREASRILFPCYAPAARERTTAVVIATARSYRPGFKAFSFRTDFDLSA